MYVQVIYKHTGYTRTEVTECNFFGLSEDDTPDAQLEINGRTIEFNKYHTDILVRDWYGKELARYEWKIAP